MFVGRLKGTEYLVPDTHRRWWVERRGEIVAPISDRDARHFETVEALGQIRKIVGMRKRGGRGLRR